MVDIITYDSFPIRGKVVDLEAIETASEKAEQAVETANQAVNTANNLVADLQDDIEEAQGYIDSFENLQETLDNKANVNGTYPSLTAGLAEQLLSSNRVVDQTPYLYRQTALGKANATRALMKKIVGGSVVWNQLVNAKMVSTAEVQGIIRTASEDKKELTYTGTATKTDNYIARSIPNMVIGHRVLIDLGKVTLPTGAKLMYSNGDKDTTTIYTLTATSVQISVRINNGTECNFTVKPMLFDLTAMFGTIIADYIYSLEQATAGSGIAKLREWGFFTEDYYDYDPGTMRSVEGVSAKETVGFNLWDEEWEVGTFNTTTGVNRSASNQLRSKNIIKILPNTTYYWKSPVYNWTILYDANGNVIPTPDVSDTGSDARSGNSFSVSANHTFTTPDNAYGMRFYTGTYIGDYNHDICINFPDPQRNGEYEPYVKHIYPLDSSLTLRGIPKLDANNSLYYDGDEYAPDGTVTRKYGMVDLGTLTWTYITTSDRNYFVASVSNRKSGDCNMISPIYVYGGVSPDRTMGTHPDKTIWTDSGTAIKVKNSTYTDATAFKTAMSGVYLVYELATPTTETAEPYTEVQVVDKDGTEQFVTTGIVPVGHVTEYPEDLVGKIDELPDLPETAGSYVLRVTVTSGKASYEWVSAS